LRNRIHILTLCVLAELLMNPASAQEDSHASHRTPGHEMAGMVDMTPASMFLMNISSGTSVNPASWPMPMATTHFGSWNTTFMGTAFLSDVQQSGPRGADKLYSTNWFMASAEHRIASDGAFQGELMVSLEPTTVTKRRYPLLFQSGETAYGKPLVDAQHPHNFIMSLGVHYVHRLGENTMLDLYAAPIGDPALGPVAFPHRASAVELPQAPISHHWQDSTHIASDVVTVGIHYKRLKVEASGFHGSEPGENRWTLQSGPIDSWSTRLWFFPTRNWAAQVSFGRIAHPEALEPGDQGRITSSIAYSRPVSGGSWSSTLAWGRTHNTSTLRNRNSYLAETVFPVRRGNLVTGRFELVDKDELFSDQADVQNHVSPPAGSFRIGAYTIGYTREIDLFRYVATGIGGNLSAYTLPGAIKSYYGPHPAGANVFVRFRLRRPGA
jgi:hypothetical protein